MQRWKDNLSAALFLIVLTSVSTLFLSFTNVVYQKVKAERQRDLRMLIYSSFGLNVVPESFDDDFLNAVEIRENKKNVFFAQKDGPLAALHVIGPGLWGEIEMLIVIDFQKRVIKELSVLSQIETAGLGARIQEKWFQDQFKNLDYSRTVKVVKERKGKTGEVDAVTGASKTSASVENIINNSLSRFAETFKERLTNE